MMNRRRPLRFGVFAESVRTRSDLLDTAQRAEDGGFSTFLIRDHFVEEPFGHQLAPLTTLATVASVTKKGAWSSVWEPGSPRGSTSRPGSCSTLRARVASASARPFRS